MLTVALGVGRAFFFNYSQSNTPEPKRARLDWSKQLNENKQTPVYYIHTNTRADSVPTPEATEIAETYPD